MSGYGRGMSGRVVCDMARESKERERKRGRRTKYAKMQDNHMIF
jgi:hypothetical protein